MAKILVIDDMVGIIKAITRTLNKEGHEIDSCTNGDEGIACVNDNDYDLIITDILMPEKDGLEFCKYVRERIEPEIKRETPIIAITGGGTLVTSEMAIEAAKIHANDVLQKPFNADQFIEVVKKYV